MASKPTDPAKRPSSTTTPTVAKPSTKIHSLAVIADRAQLSGPNTVAIDANTILHPHAKIKAEHGNVSIGKGCIIGEKSIIGTSSSQGGDVFISDGVSVEPGAVVEGKKVGEYSTIGPQARIGAGAVVGRWCKIGALSEVGEGEVLDDFTVVFGYGERRVDRTLRDREEVREMRVRGRAKEVELLQSLTPDAGAKWRGG